MTSQSVTASANSVEIDKLIYPEDFQKQTLKDLQTLLPGMEKKFPRKHPARTAIEIAVNGAERGEFSKVYSQITYIKATLLKPLDTYLAKSFEEHKAEKLAAAKEAAKRDDKLKVNEKIVEESAREGIRARQAIRDLFMKIHDGLEEKKQAYMSGSSTLKSATGMTVDDINKHAQNADAQSMAKGPTTGSGGVNLAKANFEPIFCEALAKGSDIKIGRVFRVTDYIMKEGKPVIDDKTEDTIVEREYNIQIKSADKQKRAFSVLVTYPQKEIQTWPYEKITGLIKEGRLSFFYDGKD
jgi:hypothetical protein